ncbi:armadillo-type protein [Massariosphaeria phaeospora]|uniref:Armadillo-type protein n=1 Tax=Massariosphaeria phaeospora TaxID=100035 RepID=A0A7C8I032_9PLEO|nr:armadillo-type protein [Massariosphaeria phaeospora]
MAAPAPAGHRRNKSSSMLKSIIAPKSHKRSPSDGLALNSNNNQPDVRPYNPAANLPQSAPLLPPDHPHSRMRAANAPQSSLVNLPLPRQSQDASRASPTKGLHKKTLSSVSLRALGKDKDQEENPRDKSKDMGRRRAEESLVGKPKKPKSSANLAAMFGKGKQAKAGKNVPGTDKENTTPPSSANAPGPAQAPIWAQFSSQQSLQQFQEVTTTSKVPLNDRRRSIEQEIALYTPQDYSPSKQRNFFEYGQPSLQKRAAVKERPKSTIIAGSSSTTSLLETMTRKRSNDRVPLSDTKGNEGRLKESASSKSIIPRNMLRRSSSDIGKKGSPTKKEGSSPKKPNRVMAAVAAFNGKAKQVGATATSPAKLDPKLVDAEFEQVLASRNIPTHQRAQMRTLKLEVKADFVRTHKLDTPQGSRAPSGHASIDEATGRSPTKPAGTRSAKSRDGTTEEEFILEENTATGASKRERPRSRTFTFSKSDSPTKKQRADGTANDRKASSKANPIPKSPSTRSLASNGSQRSSSKGAKTVTPNEFITYMQRTLKPQDVEVGKLHKLRLLLRNETVDWVNTFMQDGGMTELVGLLHRIMEVEWREEHEDTLLHEVLRCLKGLCTTDSALKQLAGIASTLFPALLAMLFDEEHKGPSDFTTRELIIQIIFAYISTASEADVHARATELLKYFKDPVKAKDSSTIPFILQMHQSRPYQVWCKEITNVTKEVFWIFIHHLNVIPLPSGPADPSQSYAKTHFPGPRAIVPAAPYVGGVEWDATNYIATHIDLLNGLLASIPTRDARNALRSELKISGFERLMGHLRSCNPKYYGAVHDAITVWSGAALEDGWDVKPVRMGPSDGKPPGSPVKMSPKKKAEPAPQIQAPKMDLGLGLGMGLEFEKDVGIGGAKKKEDDWI